jgi:hypothetical protein
MKKSPLPCFINNGVINASQGMPCNVTIVENNTTSFCVMVGSLVLGYINFNNGKAECLATGFTDQFDVEASLQFVATQIKP